MFKRCLYSCTLLCCSIFCFAQNTVATPTTTDVMRSHGKIYVVMAVVLTILTGLFVYLFSIEKKLKDIEK